MGASNQDKREGSRAGGQPRRISTDVRDRLTASRTRLESLERQLSDVEVVDERAFGAVVADLDELLSDVKHRQRDDAGLAVWLGGVPRGRVYAIGTAIVALIAVGLIVVSLRGNSAAVRAARYDEMYVRANALLAEGKSAEAVQAYRDAIAGLPDNEKSADAYNNLGWALQQAGKIDEAIQAYTRAVALRPGWALATNNLAAAQRTKKPATPAPSSPGPQ